MAAHLSPHTGLYQLQITVPQAAEEATGALLAAVCSQWPVSFAEPESTVVHISVFLRADQKPSGAQLAELQAGLRALAVQGIPVGKPKVHVTRLPDRDWKNSWKRHFRPLQIGRRLLLRPSWSLQRAKPGQAVVVLDPGLSFGTGQHPTTSFCLREIVNARRKEEVQSFLDIGTGSGILAVAAAKLGYGPVHAFDYDPNSVRVARANARRNRVLPRIRIRQADLCDLPARSRRKYHVVCANLLADVLTLESARILQRVKPGGLLVIAGILGKEFDSVDQDYRSRGARLLRTRAEREWQSGAYRILP